MSDQNPKYQVGQAVEAFVYGEYRPVTIKDIKHKYIVELAGTTYERDEDSIRPPRPTEEEAWEKATMLIGRRGYERYEYCCMNGEEVEDFHKETRHRVYQILGSAGIKVTDKVKSDVKRLIGIADNL